MPLKITPSPKNPSSQALNVRSHPETHLIRERLRAMVGSGGGGGRPPVQKLRPLPIPLRLPRSVLRDGGPKPPEPLLLQVRERTGRSIDCSRAGTTKKMKSMRTGSNFSKSDRTAVDRQDEKLLGVLQQALCPYAGTPPAVP